MRKKGLTDGLLQIALLLSLLRTNFDEYLHILSGYNSHEYELSEVLLGSTSAITQSSHFQNLNWDNDLGGYIHPKHIENYATHSIFRDIHNLGDFLPVGQRTISTYLLPAIQPRLQSSGEDTSSSNSQQHSSDSNNNRGVSSSLSFSTDDVSVPSFPVGDELTQEDMDLIEILWRQDIDLGVGKECFDINLRRELEKENDLESEEQRDQEKENTDELPDTSELRQLAERLVVDVETGELVPVLDEESTSAECNNAQDVSLDDALEILQVHSSRPITAAHTVTSATLTSQQRGVLTTQHSIEGRWSDVEDLLGVQLDQPDTQPDTQLFIQSDIQPFIPPAIQPVSTPFFQAEPHTSTSTQQQTTQAAFQELFIQPSGQPNTQTFTTMQQIDTASVSYESPVSFSSDFMSSANFTSANYSSANCAEHVSSANFDSLTTSGGNDVSVTSLGFTNASFAEPHDALIQNASLNQRQDALLQNASLAVPALNTTELLQAAIDAGVLTGLDNEYGVDLLDLDTNVTSLFPEASLPSTITQASQNSTTMARHGVPENSFATAANRTNFLLDLLEENNMDVEQPDLPPFTHSAALFRPIKNKNALSDSSLDSMGGSSAESVSPFSSDVINNGTAHFDYLQAITELEGATGGFVSKLQVFKETKKPEAGVMAADLTYLGDDGSYEQFSGSDSLNYTHDGVYSNASDTQNQTLTIRELPPRVSALSPPATPPLRHTHPRTTGRHIRHNHTYPAPPGEEPRERKADVQARLQKQRQAESIHSRDEKKAKQLGLPYSVEDIIHSPVEKFTDMLSRHKLTEPQLQLMKEIRRRGKNKVAAQNCRKRKLEVLDTLEEEVEALRRERDGMSRARAALDKERGKLQERYSSLYREVFGSLRDEQGSPYDPSRFTLQHTPDGNVFLVPRAQQQQDTQRTSGHSTKQQGAPAAPTQANTRRRGATAPATRATQQHVEQQEQQTEQQHEKEEAERERVETATTGNSNKRRRSESRK